MKKIVAVIGARPQFIKHAAVDLAARQKQLNLLTIHTGQHYDKNMSEVFFDQLKISKPDYNLQLGGYNHGGQTGRMMIEIEEILHQENPEGVLVYGDTNSTLAGALVGVKMHIPVYHVEAGLRSHNKKMPEEINRILTDHCSAYLFTTSQAAIDNLQKEGITKNIFNVGDVMHDMIEITTRLMQDSMSVNPYIYCTLHRPYNVDEEQRLRLILETLNSLDCRVIFPIHPRTKIKMQEFGLNSGEYKNIAFIEPVSYLENIKYLKNSEGLVTDSGGMQKEAYWLRKRCVTVRSETEWIETLDHGWNSLVFEDLSGLNDLIKQVPEVYIPLYGSGYASEKIVDIISSC